MIKESTAIVSRKKLIEKKSKEQKLSLFFYFITFYFIHLIAFVFHFHLSCLNGFFHHVFHNLFFYFTDFFDPFFHFFSGFFAPEMIITGSYDGDKVDVWSTGCVLLELLFGHRRYVSIVLTEF